MRSFFPNTAKIFFFKESCSNLYGLLAPIMKEVFTKRVLKYNFQTCRVTLLSNSKTKKYRTDRVAYTAAQIWSMLPVRCKNLQKGNRNRKLAL